MGDGKLGLLINHALSTTGAHLTMVGKHPGKLTIEGETGTKTFLTGHLPNMLFDIVIEATGSVRGFEVSLNHTKPRGTMVLKSTIASNQHKLI